MPMRNESKYPFTITSACLKTISLNDNENDVRNKNVKN